MHPMPSIAGVNSLPISCYFSLLSVCMCSCLFFMKYLTHDFWIHRRFCNFVLCWEESSPTEPSSEINHLNRVFQTLHVMCWIDALVALGGLQEWSQYTQFLTLAVCIMCTCMAVNVKMRQVKRIWSRYGAIYTLHYSKLYWSYFNKLVNASMSGEAYL